MENPPVKLAQAPVFLGEKSSTLSTGEAADSAFSRNLFLRPQMTPHEQDLSFPRSVGQRLLEEVTIASSLVVVV